MYGFTVYLAIVYAWCMSILAGIIIIFPFGKFDWWLMESLNHLHYKASKGRQRTTTTITQTSKRTKKIHITHCCPFLLLFCTHCPSLSRSLPGSVHPWLDVLFYPALITKLVRIFSFHKIYLCVYACINKLEGRNKVDLEEKWWSILSSGNHTQCTEQEKIQNKNTKKKKLISIWMDINITSK